MREARWLKTLSAIGFVAFASIPVGAKADPLSLSLVCTGPATFKHTSYTVTATGRQSTRTRTTHSNQSFFLKLEDAGGRIRLPAVMIPGGLRQGDGWWPLMNLSVSATEIAVQIRFGIFDKPRIVIDRIHGLFDTQGLLSGGFSGSCEVDKQTQPKF
jgi:hypothetical protein